MAYNALNNLIDAYIYANGVQAITGQILNGVLKQMVSQLGSGYHLMGVATPETEPAANDYAMVYFAATAGEYTDFGGITLAAGEVAVLLTSGNGSWAKQTIYNVPTGTADLENTADFITNAVTDLVNYYTKTEVDTTLADYPTLSALATALADYYTKTEIDGQKAETDAALADRYTKSETDTKLTDYYRKAETYDKDEVDSIVAALSRQEYVVAWDGTTAPDVSTIPAGVTVTYSGTPYTGTLAASASTVNKIYMVWNGVAYDMYGTSQDGGYSWVPMGTTSVDLSQYATKAEVSQLQQKVDEQDEEVYEKIDSYVHETDSEDYSELLTDDENKIIESRDGNGKKTFHCDVEFAGEVSGNLPEPPSPFEPVPVLDYVDAVLDKEDKMVEATTKDGKKVFFGGISMPDGTIVKLKLYGKKWAVLGDSFSNGSNDNGVIDEDGKYKGYRCVYPYIVGNRTGLNVLKFFEGGRTLAMPETPGDFVNSICNPQADYYYQNIPADVDYITIYLGINDHHHAPGSEGGDGEDNTGEIPLGTPTDNTTATYYGAWNVVLSWLRENRPFAHIGIIVSNGIQTDADYMNAQIAMAKKYGYPYLNLNGDERCPAMIRTANPDIPASVKTAIIQAQALDYPSNTHPNRNAHLLESTFIENFLKSL